MFPGRKKPIANIAGKGILKSYFEEVCREGKDNGKGYDRTAQREVKSFLDKRRSMKNLSDSEKRKVEWAASNLYQIIWERNGITEDIREKGDGMSLDEFKDSLFSILNETEELALADIELDDTADTLKVSLLDGSLFNVHMEKYKIDDIKCT